MPAFSAKTIRHVALLLILGIASVFVSTLIVPSPKAAANTYVSMQFDDGLNANSSSMVIDYVWSSANLRVTLALVGPSNLEAVWTNTATGDSRSAVITDASSSTIVSVTTPVNDWPVGTKVRLEVRKRVDASPATLTGIDNSGGGTPISQAPMWQVLSFGNFSPFTTLRQAFNNTVGQLRISAQLPSTVRTLDGAFFRSSFNSTLSNWVMSNVTDVQSMFAENAAFNQAIEGWDTSNVTNMSSMFRSATNFNQPIGGWDTSNVTNMARMFSNAQRFNQAIGGWNVSNVTNMSDMFYAAVRFNQGIGSWNTARVTDMSNMFESAERFNNGEQTLSPTISGTAPLNWSTPSLSSATKMFKNALVFNQSLNSFSVSSIQNMSEMFSGATFFNNGDARGSSSADADVVFTWQPVSASNMTNMFASAVSFNQDLNSWSVSSLQNMDKTFYSATRFNNGDPAGAFDGPGGTSTSMTWRTPQLNNLYQTFWLATSFNQNLDTWDVSKVSGINLNGTFTSASAFNNGDPVGAFDGDSRGSDVRMSWSPNLAAGLDYTFQNASSFNQNLNGWNISRVTSFFGAFQGATSFNNGDPVGAFDGDGRLTGSDVRMSWSIITASGQVPVMSLMFENATSFNQDLNSWSMSRVTSIARMFQGASAFNNGDPVGAFDGDGRLTGSDVKMSWSTPALTSIALAFSGASSFNQDLNSWSVSNVTSMVGAFRNAIRFNNGDPLSASERDALNSDVRMSWSPRSATDLTSIFEGATALNQNLNSWNVANVTNFSFAFYLASNFNNGDSPNAFEGDASGSNVAMTWNVSSASNISRMFSGATNFNQNIGSWNVRQVTNMDYFAGSTVSNGVFNNGASSTSTNALSWSTSTVSSAIYAFSRQVNFDADISSWQFNRSISLEGFFSGASRFNRNISGWNTTLVTNFSSMFRNATSFDQPIGSWTISNATTLASMFEGASAFNEDLSNWGPFRSDVSLQRMFVGATAMGDSPRNWDLTKISNTNRTAIDNIFGLSTSPSASAMAPTVLRSIILGWSFQQGIAATSGTVPVGYFNAPVYTNCSEWSAFRRLVDQNRWSFSGTVSALPNAPGCSTAILTWSPSVSISVSTGNVMPNAQAVTNRPSGVLYARYNPGTSNCTVNPNTGAISHAIAGTCIVMAYDADPNSVSSGQGFVVRTFTLPTPVAVPTPSAPAITTASAAAGAIGLTFNAPSTSGTAPLGGYEVGYSLTSGGATTWVTVSPVVTSSSTLNYTLSGLVNGTSYWVKVRAFNSNGSGLESQEVGPLTPATTPSSPSITNFVRSNTQIQFSISAPSTDGGSPVTRYEYRFATTAVGVDGQSWQVAASTNSPVVITGLTNGQNYFFQVRAVNAIGASSPSATSAGVTPMTTASAPVIVASTKAGTGTTATIEFLAPSSNGGSAISAYEVRSSTDEGQTWGNWAVSSTSFDVNSGRTSIFLSGLNGSALSPVYYTFEVRAQNEAGYSARSLQAPSGAEISNVVFGNQNATVSFKAAQYDGNSSILGYEYMLRTGPSSNPTSIGPWVSISSAVWQQATTTATASFNITGLTNGINYTVWVRAVNAIGGQTAAYQNWFSNSGMPNKPLPTLAFSYGVTAQSYSPTASYSPVVTTNSDGNISYTTSTPVLCNVNTTSGLVSNLRPGTCEIRVSITEGSSHQSRSATASIRTDPAGQPPLVITPSSTSAPFLGPITLTYSGGAGIGGIIVQLGVGSTCVTDGVLVTLGPVGTSCVIVATKNGDGNYLAGPSTQISLTSTKAQQAAITISNRAQMTAGTSMTLAASGGSGNGLFSFVVANAGSTGCSIAGGVLSAQTSGNCVIQASRATSNNYLQSATASLTISVVKASQNLRFTSNVPNDPQAGGSYTPAVTVSSGLTPVLSVSGACTIANGVVSFTVSGDCTIEASQSGDGTYLAAPAASQTISVGRRNQTLSFVSTSQAVQYKTFGDPAFLIQATSSEVAANISYTLSPATTNQACSVFSSGLVVVQRVGDCVVLAYSTQTAAVAAASTISKFIEIRPDFASAPFITSVARGNLSIDVGFAAPSYIGGSSMSAYSLVAIDQSLLPTPDVTSTACFHDVGNQISCRISGLENGRTYKVKVAAINGAGVGEYSILSPAVLVATNPAAVQNVRVVQGAATLQISWDDPESLGGGTFSSYRVFIKRSSAASYNSSHYFNVTSQSTRSITVSAEAPPDGMGFLGGPALVNGVAYDIKIVTVTTANTEELTGNTAVVNQIPRTVPEPPRLASSLVVGNKLVLTWTAPLSDGGSPVTSYSASVGSNPCVFAQASDTFCEIALPTAPGNYTYSIAAENVAGASTPIQGVFTVVSLNSSGGSSGGSTGGSPGGSLGGGSVNPSNPGGVIIEPGKPSESAPIVSGVSYGADKKQIVVRGTALRGVAKVFVGTTRAEVIGQSTEMIILRTPDLKYGIYPIYIHFADGNVLRVKNQLIVGKPLTQALNKTVRITGFAPGSSRLTNAMQRQLTAVFRANRGSSALVCVGHTQGPTILNSDARLAMRRAAAVCSLARQQGIKTVSASYQNNPQVGPSFRRVDLVFTR